MWLIRIALRRPITVLVLVVALGLSSILAIMRTRVDIFPNLDLPVIYVAQPYGGMSPQQVIINVSLKRGSSLKVASLENQLRQKLSKQFPDVHFSFDPGDLVNQILSFGSSSQAEVTIAGPQYADVASYTERVRQKLATFASLRDLEYEEPQRYPAIEVHVNRTIAGQLGTTSNDVATSIVDSTASSRFTAPSF
jgi:multidrug efflux pump subunit AcrB